ncbi:MAG: carbohydrate ABC transporter permease [Clostridiales bacterium]|jgi:ABC-type glycerol-3-phosphate transport system permease component|nr:carbohydrate ABC transporter permease [Clostridiales bacterium]
MKRESAGDRIFQIINTVVMITICCIMLYPIIFVAGRSLMSDVERAARPLALFPEKISMLAYSFIFMRGSYVGSAYFVTISRTIAGSACSLAVTTLAAYVLSRKEYPLRNAFTVMIVFTMWFNGGMIPNFLLVQSLNLNNKFLVYILPQLVSAWNLLIMRNFFSSIPETLFESAKIDGANDLQIYARIVMPLSGAAIATIGLFYAVWQWNAWFDSLMYVSDRSLWTMQLFLREIIRNVQSIDLLDQSSSIGALPPAESVQMATIVVATLPILCLYPFLQKFFVKGVMVGSLKG